MSFINDLKSGIEALEVDGETVYAGFGTPQRGFTYWQLIPTGGIEPGFAAGSTWSEPSFQINRAADINTQETALENAQALHDLLQERTGWTVGDYRVELCRCLQPPFLRAGSKPGAVFATFNVLMTVRKIS